MAVRGHLGGTSPLGEGSVLDNTAAAVSDRYRPMLTAPEAARVIARTLALTCADCTNGGGSGGRSAHVPDHHWSGLRQCQAIA
jgi:hypothetical protein